MMSKVLLALLALMPSAVRAETKLPVVYKYEAAAQAGVWNSKTHLFRSENPVPTALIQTVTLENPSMAYRQPYGNVFLQNERIVVCSHECDGPQNFQPQQNGQDFSVAFSKSVAENDSLIRQATVYYWVNRLFERMAELGFVPEKRLRVYVDREVRDPESGVVEDNNAFFNDKDWTLSFLPADNSVLSLLGGGFHFASAYDPSVAMHETTHSVFEALIGPILNPEILGLHEAFADYFAMSVLDSPVIGRVFGKGKPLRDASKLAKYTTEMEAHDLGHVVGSALWAIRGLYNDKLLADRVALETIREVSRNPFATAASVSVAYQAAAARLVGDAALSGKSMKIWDETGLVPRKLEVNTDVLKGKIDSSEHVVTSFSETMPDWAVLGQGVPKETKITLGLIDARPGPDKDSAWFLVSTEDLVSATAYWILYSPKSKNILAAYDLTLAPVSSGLAEIGEALSEALEWNLDFGKKVIETFKAQLEPRKIGNVPIFPSLKRDKITRGAISVNGRVIPATGHYVTIRGPILPLKLLLKLVLGKHYYELESVKSIRLVTVASAALTDDQLIEAFPGEKLVGYEIISRTGVSKKVMLEGIAEGKAPKPAKPILADGRRGD